MATIPPGYSSGRIEFREPHAKHFMRLPPDGGGQGTVSRQELANDSTALTAASFLVLEVVLFLRCAIGLCVSRFDILPAHSQVLCPPTGPDGQQADLE
jgi:hypothetical protein